MSVSEDQIQAFADGMLSEEAANEVAAAVAADPALSARVAAMRAAAAALRAAFDGVLAEPVPERFARLVAQAPAGTGNVVAFAPRLSPRAAWLSAAAAALVLAFFVGRLSVPAGEEVLVAQAGGAAARGALAHALDASASGPATASGVRVALSFPSESGDYCRVFSLAAKDPVAGLACGSRGDWLVVALAPAPRAGAEGSYAPAAGAIPDEILHAAKARQSGDALDAAAEAAAIKQGWARAAR